MVKEAQSVSGGIGENYFGLHLQLLLLLAKYLTKKNQTKNYKSV